MPPHVSASQVQVYLGCSLKYRFQYVDQIPRPWRSAAMAFGISVHAAVEWFQRERIEGRLPSAERVVTVFEADWFAQNVEPLVFTGTDSAASLIEKARALLAQYVPLLTEATPIAAEQAFEVNLFDPSSGEDLDVLLRGVIDLLEEGDVLVDVKTAGRMLEQGGLERHLQLSTYALAHYLIHEKIPKLRLDILLKLKSPRVERLETSRTIEDLAWTSRLIQGVVTAIRAGHFFPNPSWRCCECEYFAHCQTWRG